MKLIRISEVAAKTAKSRSAIYAALKAGRFPKPVPVGERTAWVESEIDAYIAEQIARRDAPEATARANIRREALTKAAQESVRVRRAVKAGAV